MPITLRATPSGERPSRELRSEDVDPPLADVAYDSAAGVPTRMAGGKAKGNIAPGSTVARSSSPLGSRSTRSVFKVEADAEPRPVQPTGPERIADAGPDPRRELDRIARAFSNVPAKKPVR